MPDRPSDKLARRRFLADLLFLGGSLATAALLGQLGASDQPPDPDAPGFPEVQSYQGGLLER